MKNGASICNLGDEQLIGLLARPQGWPEQRPALPGIARPWRSPGWEYRALDEARWIPGRRHRRLQDLSYYHIAVKCEVVMLLVYRNVSHVGPVGEVAPHGRMGPGRHARSLCPGSVGLRLVH